MKWLTRLVAVILVVCLTLLIIVEVIDHTLLSPSFLEQKAKANNSYSQLSEALSSELISNASLIGNQQAINKVHEILTPALLEDKLNSVLEQTIAHYKSNGPTPTIDLTAEENQLQIDGLQLGQDNPLAKPITLNNNASIKLVADKFEEFKLVTLLVSLILIALVVFLSWERHRYAVLPDIALIVGILITLIGVGFSLLSGFSNKFINLNSNSNSTAFVKIAHDLADSIAHGLGVIFLIIGLVLFIGGLIFRLTLAKPKKAAKPKK